MHNSWLIMQSGLSGYRLFVFLILLHPFISVFTFNHFLVQLSAIWRVQPSWGKRVGWSKFSFSQKFTASIKCLDCTYFMFYSLHVHTNARSFLHCCCMRQVWRMTKAVLQTSCLLFCHLIYFVLTFEGKREQRMVSWKRHQFLTSSIAEASICNIIWRRRERIMKEEEAEEEMTKHEESSACTDDFPHNCSSHFALSLYMSQRRRVRVCVPNSVFLMS
jgi:hypothetical protein